MQPDHTPNAPPHTGELWVSPLEYVILFGQVRHLSNQVQLGWESVRKQPRPSWSLLENEQGPVSVSLYDPGEEVFPNAPLEPFQLPWLQEMQGQGAAPPFCTPGQKHQAYSHFPASAAHAGGYWFVHPLIHPMYIPGEKYDLCKIFPGGNWPGTGT